MEFPALESLLQPRVKMGALDSWRSRYTTPVVNKRSETLMQNSQESSAFGLLYKLVANAYAEPKKLASHMPAENIIFFDVENRLDSLLTRKCDASDAGHADIIINLDHNVCIVSMLPYHPSTYQFRANKAIKQISYGEAHTKIDFARCIESKSHVVYSLLSKYAGEMPTNNHHIDAQLISGYSNKSGDVAGSKLPYSYDVLKLLFRYFLPVVYATGIVGNVLCVVVCQSKRLRHFSSSIHLTALAIYDTMTIIPDMLGWLTQSTPATVIASQLACQLNYYFLTVNEMLSTWCVTIFTAERFVAVFYPLKRAQLCTPSTAKKLLLMQLPVPILFHIYLPITHMYQYEPETELHILIPRPEYMSLNLWLSLIRTILVGVFPNIIVVTLNVCIMFKGSSTMSLLIVAIGCTALKIPYTVSSMYMHAVLSSNQVHLWTRSWETYNRYALLIYITSSSSNFLLYHVSSRRYRDAAGSVFCQRCKQQSNEQLSTAVSLAHMNTVNNTRTTT